jgi:hypothetical protein
LSIDKIIDNTIDNHNYLWGNQNSIVLKPLITSAAVESIESEGSDTRVLLEVNLKGDGRDNIAYRQICSVDGLGSDPWGFRNVVEP